MDKLKEDIWDDAYANTTTIAHRGQMSMQYTKACKYDNEILPSKSSGKTQVISGVYEEVRICSKCGRPFVMDSDDAAWWNNQYFSQPNAKGIKGESVKVITIKEETKIPQEDGTDIVLEAGDKIKVMEKEQISEASSIDDVINEISGKMRNMGVDFRNMFIQSSELLEVLEELFDVTDDSQKRTIRRVTENIDSIKKDWGIR